MTVKDKVAIVTGAACGIGETTAQVFAERAKMERETGGTCITGTWLDELDPAAGRDDGPVVEECGAMCELLANTGISKLGGS